MTREVALRQQQHPHSKLAVWFASDVDLPKLHGYKRVRLRHSQGTLMVSQGHVNLPQLASADWPDPPKGEEVSAAEAERRHQAKYTPVNLHTQRFVEFGFPQPVVDIVKGVPILYLGDRVKLEKVAQYPLSEADGTLAATAKEVDRAIACEAILPPPPGVTITKVHSFVTVFKGGKTRVCLDLGII